MFTLGVYRETDQGIIDCHRIVRLNAGASDQQCQNGTQDHLFHINILQDINYEKKYNQIFKGNNGFYLSLQSCPALQIPF